MLRYKLLGDNVISVDLKNGYTIVAISIWDRGENNYKSTLYIKNNGYDTLELINTKEGITVDATFKTIRVELTKIITDLLEQGFFEKCIKEYDYMMKCFDKGNELFEENGFKF